MGIEVTGEAAETLRRSMQLGRIDPSTGGVRLRTTRALGGGIGVQVELTDAPLEGEDVVEAGGVRLFVDRSVREALPDAVVALEPQHEVVVVRPKEEQ
jgi:hypothetical protein